MRTRTPEVGTAMRRFPQRLREARLARGWTQDDLDARTRIGKPRISRYECAHISPTLWTVEILAEALRVDPAWLCGWKADA